MTHFPVLLQMQEVLCSLPVHVGCSLATSIIHPAQPHGVTPGSFTTLFFFSSKVSSGISAPAVLWADEESRAAEGFFFFFFFNVTHLSRAVPVSCS